MSNAAFTLNDFDDQERNLTFVKTNFQVFKLEFHPAIISRLSILFVNYISRDLDNTKILLYKFFVLYLVVKPACVNATLDGQIIGQTFGLGSDLIGLQVKLPPFTNHSKGEAIPLSALPNDTTSELAGLSSIRYTIQF